jgi:ATP-dependent Clp protease adapter protein ClpS
MIKTTTTLSRKKTAVKTKKAKKIHVISDDFGPSDFTIQNILNYSKALQVINLTTAATVLGVMN